MVNIVTEKMNKSHACMLHCEEIYMHVIVEFVSRIRRCYHRTYMFFLFFVVFFVV